MAITDSIMAITEQDVALSEGADTNQPEEATTEEPRPGGRTPRERFDALPEDLKDKILDEHRHWNVEHIDWWDSVYDQFKYAMGEIGIDVDRMYFSGFWSQGDGACFEGSVSDWSKFLTSLGKACPALITNAEHNGWKFHVTHSGYYYHENCTDFSETYYLNHPDNSDASDDDDWLRWCSPYKTDIQNAAFLAMLREHNIDDLHAEFAEAFKDHMRDLYKRLEEEYDYLTSDEAVLDSLEANDQLEEAINDAMETDHA